MLVKRFKQQISLPNS